MAVGELARLARRDEQALAAAPDHALVAVDVGAHDRRAGGHRLEQDDAERFAAGRRRDVHVGGPEELGLLGVRHAAEELDALQAAGRDVAPRLPLLRAGADDEQARRSQPVLRRIRCALSRSSRPLRGSWRPTNRMFGVPSCQRAIGTASAKRPTSTPLGMTL